MLFKCFHQRVKFSIVDYTLLTSPSHMAAPKRKGNWEIFGFFLSDNCILNKKTHILWMVICFYLIDYGTLPHWTPISLLCRYYSILHKVWEGAAHFECSTECLLIPLVFKRLLWSQKWNDFSLTLSLLLKHTQFKGSFFRKRIYKLVL